jgi:phosphatidylserine/phosphatidylglycerophosphate/cardiolipin synthase-like enzyme
MNLLVLPDDGLGAVLRAIRHAKQSVRLTIFRCDLPEVEKALEAAVVRGVAVHALIAHTNRAGEKQLRALELRLLGAGVTISRTDDDLVRYHNKVMIVDERVLYVMAFNFTRSDVGKRRSMAIATRKRRLVSEALRLYEADSARQEFEVKTPDLVISPLNARERISRLLKSARRSLWIYDPQAIDTALLRQLKQKAESGVEVRVIGKVGRVGEGLAAELPGGMRLHLRAILRDQLELFLGSQGLRGVELDRRRELGVVIRDRSSIKRFKHIFETDWADTKYAREQKSEDTKEDKKEEKKDDKKSEAA